MVYCNKCKKSITLDVYKASWKKHHNALCVECQPKPYSIHAEPSKFTLGEKQSRRKSKITSQASVISDILRGKGWNAISEYDDGYKHVDIAILEANVYIEVDGPHHALKKEQALKDLKRTYYSFKNDNIVTLRIPNCLMENSATIQETAEFINEFLKAGKAKASGSR